MRHDSPASPADLPPSIQYAWHGINDHANLREFAKSPIEWGEIDVRLDPASGQLVAYHDPLAEAARRGVRTFLTIPEFIATLLPLDKSFKFDLKEGGPTVVKLLELVRLHGISDSRLWFNSYVEQDAGIDEFPAIRDRHPSSIRQCPIGPLLVSAGNDVDAVRRELVRRTEMGMTRFSLSWRSGRVSGVKDWFGAWGYELNIYDIPDLSEFLRALKLGPRSLTADFNFPEWGLYGRASGEGGRYHTFV